MDTRIWIGALVGALATLVIVGGVVVVRAATGPMDMMGGGMMAGMMHGGDMDAMHEECREMMEEHEDEGSEDRGNTTAVPSSVAANYLQVRPLALT